MFPPIIKKLEDIKEIEHVDQYKVEGFANNENMWYGENI